MNFESEAHVASQALASEALSSAALWGQTAGVWGAAPVQVGSRDSAPGMAMSYGVEPRKFLPKYMSKM